MNDPRSVVVETLRTDHRNDILSNSIAVAAATVAAYYPQVSVCCALLLVIVFEAKLPKLSSHLAVVFRPSWCYINFSLHFHQLGKDRICSGLYTIPLFILFFSHGDPFELNFQKKEKNRHILSREITCSFVSSCNEGKNDVRSSCGCFFHEEGEDRPRGGGWRRQFKLIQVPPWFPLHISCSPCAACVR